MNSEKNVQVIQQLYTAFGQGDLPAILGLLDPAVDWQFVGQPEDVPHAGQRHGHDEVAQFFTIIGQTVEVQSFEPREMRAIENGAVVLGHSQAQVKRTGRTFATDWIHLFDLRDGKITRMREFYDTATMAAAYR